MKYNKEDGGGTIRISDHVGDKIINIFLFLSGLVYLGVFIPAPHDFFYNNLGLIGVFGV